MDGVDLGTFKPPKQVLAGASDDNSGLLEIYRQMVRCRFMDERVWLLNRQGKAAIVASAQGHEACQVASVWALDKTKCLEGRH
jgi:TPP-dependent pyruvate/acetoin dehydrogenase alpha subunit